MDLVLQLHLLIPQLAQLLWQVLDQEPVDEDVDEDGGEGGDDRDSDDMVSCFGASACSRALDKTRSNVVLLTTKKQQLEVKVSKYYTKYFLHAHILYLSISSTWSPQQSSSLLQEHSELFLVQLGPRQ